MSIQGSNVRIWLLGVLASPPSSLPGRLAGGVPGLLGSRAILDRHHALGPLPAEPLPVQVLDELRQRRLPRLLIMVVELAELPRVHPELARHLHLRVRQPEPLPRLDPVLQVLRQLPLGLGVPSAPGGTSI